MGKSFVGKYFVGKYFVVGHSTTKTTKILPHEKYPLYGISFTNLPLHHTFTAILKNKEMSSTVTESKLFGACARGDLATVRRAVAEGLEVKNAVNMGLLGHLYTPLHYASEYEN